MTGWVDPPHKWNKMKKAIVKAARTLNMATLRMKSLVSDVGQKSRVENQNGMHLQYMMSHIK